MDRTPKAMSPGQQQPNDDAILPIGPRRPRSFEFELPPLAETTILRLELYGTDEMPILKPTDQGIVRRDGRGRGVIIRLFRTMFRARRPGTLPLRGPRGRGA